MDIQLRELIEREMKVEKGERENIKYMFFVPILSKYLRFSHFDLQMI